MFSLKLFPNRKHFFVRFYVKDLMFLGQSLGQFQLLSLFIGAFDPSIPEEGPSVPPAGWLDSVMGYEDHKEGGRHIIAMMESHRQGLVRQILIMQA